MPELPEVETIARDLQIKVKDTKVIGVEVLDRRIIRPASIKTFISAVRGKTFSKFSRRGKSVIAELAPKGFLIIQPKMSGYVLYLPSAKKEPQASALKAVFRLSNGGALHYNDHRMFGRLYYADDLAGVLYLQTLGPEPLEKGFTVDLLQEMFKKRTTPVKAALMNQELIAGIGNIYASEILFEAKINPRRSCRMISSAEIENLHRSIRRILKQAIEERGCSMRDYRDTSGVGGSFMTCIRVYGRGGQPCPLCGRVIEKIVQTQRSTFFCSHCQH